jgi:hypothetical protein
MINLICVSRIIIIIIIIIIAIITINNTMRNYKSPWFVFCFYVFVSFPLLLLAL